MRGRGMALGSPERYRRKRLAEWREEVEARDQRGAPLSRAYADVARTALAAGHLLFILSLLPFLYYAVENRVVWEPLVLAMVAAPCIATLGGHCVIGVGVILCRLRGHPMDRVSRAGLASKLWFNFWWLAAWTAAWLAGSLFGDRIGGWIGQLWPYRDFGIFVWLGRGLVVLTVYVLLSALGTLITSRLQGQRPPSAPRPRPPAS